MVMDWIIPPFPPKKSTTTPSSKKRSEVSCLECWSFTRGHFFLATIGPDVDAMSKLFFFFFSVLATRFFFCKKNRCGLIKWFHRVWMKYDEIASLTVWCVCVCVHILKIWKALGKKLLQEAWFTQLLMFRVVELPHPRDGWIFQLPQRLVLLNRHPCFQPRWVADSKSPLFRKFELC